MTSPIVLLLLVTSLCLAVLIPEYKTKGQLDFQTNSFNNLVSRQRKVYAILGSAAVITFALAIELLSVPLFITHLVLDCLFGIYVRSAVLYRREVRINNLGHVSIGNEAIEYANEYVQLHDRDESQLKEAV